MTSAEHWSDDQLIAYLYGVGPAAASTAHIEGCAECRNRAAAMQLARTRVEASQDGVEVNTEQLLAQRRAIYARLEQRPRWRAVFHLHRWAQAACVFVVLGGGFAAWEHRGAWFERSQQQAQRANISDEQLVDDASQIANDVAPDATAPLHALFEDE